MVSIQIILKIFWQYFSYIIGFSLLSFSYEKMLKKKKESNPNSLARSIKSRVESDTILFL